MGQHLSSRPIIASLLTACLLTLPTSASAGEPLQLIVDTSKLAEADRESLRTTIAASVSETLTTEGRELVDTAPTTLRVRIEYLDEENLDYAIVYEVLEGSESLGEAASLTCTGCVEAKLVRTIDEGVPAALVRVDELMATKVEAPAEQPPTEPIVDEPPAARVAPIGALGIVGSVIAAGGVATLVVGGLELPKGSEYGAPNDSGDVIVREHGRTGQLLLATGAGVLVVGVAMLATDVALRSKRNRAAKSRAARVPTPMLAPGFVGMGLSGRF